MRLLRAYHLQGDTSARRNLIELYMPLVESLARRYDRRGEEHDDLVQVGSIGLINAIDRFDVSRGGELAAFAVPTIEGEIKRHLRDRGSAIRLPRELHEHADPSTRQAAEPLPLDSAAESPQARTSGGELEHSEERLLLASGFRGLNEHERKLLYLRYVREESAAAVAGELGISERQVSRRTRSALDKLRKEIEEGHEPRPGDLPRGRPAPNIAAMAATRAAVPDRYLSRPYHISLVKTGDGASGWTAHVEELQGCEASGSTPVEATHRLEKAMEEWIAAALAEHREVPEPRSAKGHSGRLLLRMPQSLHTELAEAAEREEVSLNQFITSSLASVVEWQRDGHAPRASQGASGNRWLRAALVANIVVVALAGIAAVVLLVIAWQSGW